MSSVSRVTNAISLLHQSFMSGIEYTEAIDESIKCTEMYIFAGTTFRKINKFVWEQRSSIEELAVQFLKTHQMAKPVAHR